MLKSILIFLLLAYFLISFSGKIIRFLYWITGSTPKQKTYYKSQRSKPRKNGALSIEYIPEDEVARQKRNFKGGEYTDYEEVK